jgi:hypothetical protein
MVRTGFLSYKTCSDSDLLMTVIQNSGFATEKMNWLNHEAHLNNVEEFSSHLSESRLWLHCLDKLLNPVFTIYNYPINMCVQISVLCSQRASSLVPQIKWHWVQFQGLPPFNLFYEQCVAAGGMIGRENCSARRKTSLSATSLTTKLTLLDRGTNSSYRGGNLPTNLLSYGTAIQQFNRCSGLTRSVALIR